MKIGVISDTHLQGVDSRLSDIYGNYFADTDLILHAGDIVSMEVVDFLSSKPLHVVQGNMDNKEIKEKFPRTKIIEVQGFRLGLIHGWGSPVGIEKRIKSEFKNVHAIIYGHSHRAVNHIVNDILFFNPGTATGFSISGSHSIGILYIGTNIQGEIITIE